MDINHHKSLKGTDQKRKDSLLEAAGIALCVMGPAVTAVVFVMMSVGRYFGLLT